MRRIRLLAKSVAAAVLVGSALACVSTSGQDLINPDSLPPCVARLPESDVISRSCPLLSADEIDDEIGRLFVVFDSKLKATEMNGDDSSMFDSPSYGAFCSAEILYNCALLRLIEPDRTGFSYNDMIINMIMENSREDGGLESELINITSEEQFRERLYEYLEARRERRSSISTESPD